MGACASSHSLRSVCGSAVGADPPCMATHVRAYFPLATPQGPNSVLCPLLASLSPLSGAAQALGMPGWTCAAAQS